MSDVVITQQDIYDLLLDVKTTVSTLVTERSQDANRLNDHEERIRDIEAREDLSRRVTELEAFNKALIGQVEDIKRRVWAIPGASVVIAGSVLIFTLIRTY